jgi:hypothetical protein
MRETHSEISLSQLLMSTCTHVSVVKLDDSSSRLTSRRNDNKSRMRVRLSPTVRTLFISMPISPFVGSF